MKRPTPGVRQRRAAALWLLVFALLLPGTVMAAPSAQQATLDPALLAAIRSGAAAVYRTVLPARAAPGLPPEESVAEAVPEATATEAPVEEAVADPTPEPTAEVAEGQAGEVEVENAGINLLVPGSWEVVEGEGEMVFSFADPERSFEGVLNTTTDFPGLILFPVLERNPDLFAQSMGEGTVIEGIARFDVEQGIPAIRLAFSGADSGEGLMDGAMYVYGPGEAVYMMFAAAPADQWPAVAEEADLAAASILFDENLITLETAGEGGLEVEDPNGLFGFTMPAGWLVTPANMEEMPFTFTDPNVSVVGLVGMPPTSDGDAFAQALTEAAADSLSDEGARELIKAAISALDIEQDGMLLDEQLTDVFTFEGGETILIARLGGEADLGDGLILPMMIYAALNADGAIAFVLMGETDTVLGMEDVILPMVESAAPVQ